MLHVIDDREGTEHIDGVGVKLEAGGRLVDPRDAAWRIADSTATDEANELAAIFWLAHGLPEAEGRHIQELARSYARGVVYEEWQLMAEGKDSPEGWPS